MARVNDFASPAGGGCEGRSNGGGDDESADDDCGNIVASAAAVDFCVELEALHH